MTYKPRMKTYAGQNRTIDVISLQFNGSQHVDTVLFNNVPAIYQEKLIQTVSVDGGAIVSSTVSYYSFDAGLAVRTGYYIVDGPKRWLVKDVLNAVLAGNRVLVRVEAVL